MFDLERIIDEDGAEFREWSNNEHLTCTMVLGDDYGHGVRIWLDAFGEPVFVSRMGYTPFENCKPTDIIKKYL